MNTTDNLLAETIVTDNITLGPDLVVVRPVQAGTYGDGDDKSDFVDI